MYFRSHIYCTRKITESKDPYLLFGCLFGDFHYTNLLPNNFQNQYLKLLKFLKKKHPSLLNLGIGLCLHEIPIGVDRFIHQSYKNKRGYAYWFVDDLFKDTKQRLGFDDNTTILMTHFLVENAIEYHILKNHPEIEDLLATVFNKIDVNLVCKVLSELYKVDSDKFKTGFQKFKELIFDYDYASFEGQSKPFADTVKLIFGKDIDKNQIKDLIAASYDLINDSVEEFINDCIFLCKEDFKKNFPSF